MQTVRKKNSCNSMHCSMNNENHILNNKQQELLPLFMDHIPAAFLEKAEIELHETKEKKVECLKEILERIKGDNTLEDIDFHNDFLIQFLRHSKYDVQKTLNKLKNFMSYTINQHPLLVTITEEKFKIAKSANILKCLPKRTPDGCAILLFQYGNWDTSQLSAYDFNSYVFMMVQQCLRDPMTQINGFACIHDWRNMTFRIFRQFTPKILFDGSKVYLDCVPARYREIHLINHPSAIKIIWSVLKPLISEKLKKRIIFHSDPNDLLSCIPPSVIPEYIGGCLEEESYNSTMSNWLTKAFEEQQQFPLGGYCNFY